MKKEIVALREEMKSKGVDCYIVPTGDFHGSEYINDYFKTRAFLSGFTGSAGTLVVTHQDAKLWVDSRYYLQGEMQLEGSGITMVKAGLEDSPSIEDYLKSVMEEGMVLGFDGRVVIGKAGEAWEEIATKAGGSINPHLDLAGDIWENRPTLEGAPIWVLPETSYGTIYQEKISKVREAMEEADADYYFVADLMENAYLYNLRGGDVSHTPVFFSYSLIGPNQVTLYTFRKDAPVPNGVQIKEYFDAEKDLLSLPEGAKVLMDPITVSYGLIKSLPENVTGVFKPSPLSFMKAIKDPIEIASTKKAHLEDGIAMAEFIYALKEEMNRCKQEGLEESPWTEISASDYLLERRKSREGFLDISFTTIAGYGPHGAIVHYGATAETDVHLKPQGFFLVDSGGQYLTGTTDITRTIAMGPLTQEMKRVYTAVLKGHIALATCTFPPGTPGSELDTMVRNQLQQYGYSYGHGTGHGVGHVLGVHEGPQSISMRGSDVAMEPGMVVSNEPGYYPEGEFGVRIENIILCTQYSQGEEPVYGFQDLTLCPYEKAAIIKDELTAEEIEYVNNYHQMVKDLIMPFLSTEVGKWLEDACSPL